MGAFTNCTVTAAGMLAVAKVLSGQSITFTKIVMGDGFLSEGQDVQNIESVISPKVTVDITRRKVESANTAVIGGVFTNGGLEDGFWWREVGLYAQDPDEDVGEILFCYGNSGDTSEYIPANGGNTVIEKNIDITTYVGNAANVKIYIAPDAYPTKADFDDLRQEVASGIAIANEAKSISIEARNYAQEALEQVLEYANMISDFGSELRTLWDAVFLEIVSNPWQLTFADLTGINLTSGVWNKARQRLEC